MINSQLINDIFDLGLDDLQYKDLLIQQINYLTINEIEHTGVGMYIYFQKDKEIYNYKAIEQENTILNGVEISNEDLGILADVIIHVRNGIIDCVEIWNKNGENYPTIEPTQYELTRLWIDNAQRRIIKR